MISFALLLNSFFLQNKLQQKRQLERDLFLLITEFIYKKWEISLSVLKTFIITIKEVKIEVFQTLAFITFVKISSVSKSLLKANYVILFSDSGNLLNFSVPCLNK